MMAKTGVLFTVISLFIGLLVYSSEAHAFLIDTWATGGANLALNDRDWTDGWTTNGPNTDFVAEATHNSTVAPYRDQGYAKGSLTGNGVELKSRSYAPDVYANSGAKITDRFKIASVPGTPGGFLDADLNFELGGNIVVSGSPESNGSLRVDMLARQGDPIFGPVLDFKQIIYEVSWDSTSNQYVGFNDNENWDDLYQVNPTITGLSYNFGIPISLDLDQMSTDDWIYLSLYIGTNGELATVDFSNTLKTNQNNPFVITSSPPGSSYQLVTDYIEVDGVGLFGNLDGEIVGAPVPVPATIVLLGSGLVCLAGFRKKFRKR